MLGKYHPKSVANLSTGSAGILISMKEKPKIFKWCFTSICIANVLWLLNHVKPADVTWTHSMNSWEMADAWICSFLCQYSWLRLTCLKTKWDQANLVHFLYLDTCHSYLRHSCFSFHSLPQMRLGKEQHQKLPARSLWNIHFNKAM